MVGFIFYGWAKRSINYLKLFNKQPGKKYLLSNREISLTQDLASL
jgi:hypothetical protein